MINSIPKTAVNAPPFFKVTIQNERPLVLTCTGRNFDETKEMNFHELILFIERDLHLSLSKLEALQPRFEASLIQHDGLNQIRVAVIINDEAACVPIELEVENILCSYNQQTMAQKSGLLKALQPRFQFQVTVSTQEDGGQNA